MLTWNKWIERIIKTSFTVKCNHLFTWSSVCAQERLSMLVIFHPVPWKALSYHPSLYTVSGLHRSQMGKKCYRFTDEIKNKLHDDNILHKHVCMYSMEKRWMVVWCGTHDLIFQSLSVRVRRQKSKVLCGAQECRGDGAPDRQLSFADTFSDNVIIYVSSSRHVILLAWRHL